MVGESGASQQHSASSGASGGGADVSGASGGGELNFQELFESTQRELSDTKSHAAQIEQRLKLVDSQTKQTNESLQRVRTALMGEEDNSQAPSPTEAKIQGLQAQMDQYIEAAIEAERAGRPIPLTVNSAVQSLKFQIETLQEREQYQREIAELKAKIDQTSNPANQIDQMAYSNIDSHLVSALSTIFGPEEDTSAQFQAISNQIVKEIKDLKKSEPATWDRVRRDKSAQAKLVNYFVEKSIPPRARQLMRDDQIRREPISNDEMLNAYREAKELAAKGNGDARKHATELRQELLQRVLENSAPRMGKRDY